MQNRAAMMFSFQLNLFPALACLLEMIRCEQSSSTETRTRGFGSPTHLIVLTMTYLLVGLIDSLVCLNELLLLGLVRQFEHRDAVDSFGHFERLCKFLL